LPSGPENRYSRTVRVSRYVTRDSSRPKRKSFLVGRDNSEPSVFARGMVFTCYYLLQHAINVRAIEEPFKEKAIHVKNMYRICTKYVQNFKDN